MNARTTLTASLEATQRFDRRDTYLEASVSRRFARGGGYLAAGGAPDADYRPEFALSGGGEVPVGAGFAATLDASVAWFPVGAITTVQPGVQWSEATGRLILSARWVNAWDETEARQDGYALRASLAVTSKVTLRSSLADAPETSEGVTTTVLSRSLGIDLALTDQVVVRLTGTHEDRGTYDRRELALGVGWRF
jgi:YaiO family outer membrane protein